jgi:hypothetical protein
MTDWVLAGLFAVAGVGVGVAYFALVRRTAQRIASGQVRVAGAVGAAALRLLLFAPLAVVSAMLSLVALAAYVTGFVGARLAAVRATCGRQDG